MLIWKSKYIFSSIILIFSNIKYKIMYLIYFLFSIKLNYIFVSNNKGWYYIKKSIFYVYSTPRRDGNPLADD